MPISLGSRKEHGFDEPLGLLSDCHRRIEHFLGILERVWRDLKGATLTDEYRRAIQAGLAYFDTAAPRHTADEEHSLFPRMREAGGPAVQEALARLAELEADHDTADGLHAEARTLFHRWLEAGSLPEPDAARLGAVLTELQDLYRRHIALEDNEIFPLAGKTLPSEQLVEVGREMAQRRGISSGGG